MVIVVSGDVVTRVATTYYDCLLSMGILGRLTELRGVDQTVAFEVANPVNACG